MAVLGYGVVGGLVGADGAGVFKGEDCPAFCLAKLKQMPPEN